MGGPGGDGGGWRWAAPRLIALFLAARLLVVLCAAGVEVAARPTSAGVAGSELRATDQPILGSLTSWDAVYYLDIARDGYQPGAVNGPYPTVVFFPLYPALVSAAAPLLGEDLPLSGVLVANLCALGGLAAAHALMRQRLAPRAAMLASAFVALQPGAVAFSMAYADGLFLALVCGALLAGEAGRVGRWSRPLAGALAFLAALTRLQGTLLLVPLAILWWRQDRGRPRPSWLWSLGGPAGLAAFCVAVSGVTGDVLAPIRAQAAWDFGAVSGAVADGWVIVVAALAYGLSGFLELRLLWDRWRAGIDRAGVGWAAINLAAMVVARRIQSLPRYLAPVTALPEQLASGRYASRTVPWILAASVAAYVVLAVLHFGLWLAP
jgi:Mannosyltransferase (PIG-V)